MSEMIRLDNVCFDYEADEHPDSCQGIIKNISLSIEKGTFVALLGHNGSGKSTLAKLMNGILLPNSGKVTVEGIDTADEERIWDIRRRVGMVFQNPDNQIVATTVEEDVAFGPENLGIEPSEIRRRVDKALESVHMSEYKTHSPSQLSGGQKQRIAIAGILAMEPECILFDESTAMLDPHGREEVMAQIMRLRREGMTVVLITHYMNEAVFADRVIVVNDGEIALDDTPAKVFSQVETLRSLGLDVPQVTHLAHLLAEDGYGIRRDLLFEDEAYGELSALLKK
ncbi:MAG: energy-coupling factor transporter ATPase [Clostridia bacterium]|nr:energy-coupling factor transporter ATPase [Clostridia bacterium]